MEGLGHEFGKRRGVISRIQLWTNVIRALAGFFLSL